MLVYIYSFKYAYHVLTTCFTQLFYVAKHVLHKQVRKKYIVHMLA